MGAAKSMCETPHQPTSLWRTSQMALFKQFSDNPSFKRWLTDTIFAFTYEQ
jgi:hypothetical protein